MTSKDSDDDSPTRTDTLRAHAAKLRETAKTLPVYASEDALLDAVRHHQVVVVEGPTGSGKTTQLPQMLREAGITEKLIGLTQPRRIAAISVCWRIADEQGCEVGDDVGYTIRFDDQSSPATKIRVMTDGILLQHAREQPDFDDYGVIIIDEAHERSLNIDFLLGLLHGAVRKRADLRVIISSATIDPEHFVRFFSGIGTAVPRVHIDARPHPVSIQYNVPRSSDPDDILDSAAWEVEGICHSGDPGHVLVFLSGEAAIRGVKNRLEELGVDAHVLPLYGALKREQQEQIFAELGGRKVILTTNIAETSITVPGVRFVIDSGVAKVPRVQPQTGVRTLREEQISRASADQRAGRAGRTGPGVAIRLYPKHVYDDAPRFTTEAILRLDLREVVLRLVDVGIQDLEAFPFPTRPQRKRLAVAIEQLQAMGAIDNERNLTRIGRRMTPFPLTPRTARMVVEAADRFPDVVDEVLMVAAWMSGRRPFRFPQGEEREARTAQRAFAHPLGDAATAVTVVRAYYNAQDKASFCERSYLDPDTMTFLVHAHEQLKDVATAQGIEVKKGGKMGSIVRCVAAGYADQILVADGRNFVAPGGLRCGIHPASSLFRVPVRYIVAADILVLKRPYATNCSALKPEWIADVNPDLADHLQLRRAKDRTKKKGGVQKSELPDAVHVGGVELPVVLRRGRVQVDVPWEKVETLKEVRKFGLRDVDPAVAGLKARVLIGDDAWLAGMPLVPLLYLLPMAPLPNPKADLSCRVPEGALLELDRNGHTLERHLPDLLKPMRPGRGKRPGWAALVSNGAGGFWFEISTDLPDASAQTLGAIDDWIAGLADGDPLLDRLIAAREPIAKLADRAMEAARMRKPRRGRRHR
ncbi:MAG: ATP-dependent RNA helicase [Myxococcales bacterium]|nr:ATP-dependent RNA helicase [Myxococcales bacterium]